MACWARFLVSGTQCLSWHRDMRIMWSGHASIPPSTKSNLTWYRDIAVLLNIPVRCKKHKFLNEWTPPLPPKQLHWLILGAPNGLIFFTVTVYCVQYTKNGLFFKYRLYYHRERPWNIHYFDGNWSVARAKHWVGCYQRSTQQGPYPADYSNVSMAKSCGCLSHSFVYVYIWGHG